MGVIIDREKCIGCGRCIGICPGNVIRRDERGRAYLGCPSDCWNCASCMKECKNQAIYMYLPPESGGRGGKMFLRQSGHRTEWEIYKADGSRISLVTDTGEANKY